MPSGTVDFSTFKNDLHYQRPNIFVRALWYITNACCLINPFSIFNRPKIFVLRIFGAKIGKRVVIKPRVNIRSPWLLTMGDDVWIGEGVWIENLDAVRIGSNVCISQGAFILCASHNYKKTNFPTVIGPVVLEDGVWIGARATVTHNVTCGNHAVLTANSTANNDLEPYGIYRGNPAGKIRDRVID